jgi:hypothetical protein
MIAAPASNPEAAALLTVTPFASGLRTNGAERCRGPYALAAPCQAAESALIVT